METSASGCSATSPSNVDGQPFKLATPRKTLPILAYLLLHRESPVARDFLAYVMWPDDEEESARNKLRMSLYDLARILPSELGDGALAVDSDNVQLRPAPGLWLDVDEFDRLIRDPERTEEAIALYRGDLLASLYDEWIFPERERRRNAYLGALANLVSRARRQRHFRSGITRARQILSMDPWREDIVRQLIALRSESGDRAGALAEYEGFAQRLRDELSVDPMPETVSLKEAIAAGTPLEADRPFESTETPLSSRPPILPFVGRHAEMGRLLEAWSRAARGRGTCVFIGGEAGIGKSRIAREFAHAVEDRGGRVLFGATGSPETAPYESIVDALHSALPLVASLKPDMWLAAVAALLPEIRSRVPKLPEVAALDAESERIRLFEALNRCLAGLAAPRPLLVVLEDLHWAQSATIALLDFLVRHVAGVPIMIVATYRDDETPRPHPLHRLHREMRATGTAQSLSLTPFSLGDVREAIETLPEVRDCPRRRCSTPPTETPSSSRSWSPISGKAPTSPKRLRCARSSRAASSGCRPKLAPPPKSRPISVRASRATPFGRSAAGPTAPSSPPSTSCSTAGSSARPAAGVCSSTSSRIRPFARRSSKARRRIAPPPGAIASPACSKNSMPTGLPNCRG